MEWGGGGGGILIVSRVAPCPGATWGQEEAQSRSTSNFVSCVSLYNKVMFLSKTSINMGGRTGLLLESAQMRHLLVLFHS